MTASLFEFLILARVAGFGAVVYGVWLSLPRRGSDRKIVV